MCGRYTLTSPEDIAARFGLGALAETRIEPRFNVSPSQLVPVVRTKEEGPALEYMQWGFQPHWMQGKSKRLPPINARGETLLERPMFKGAANKGRCLIPADVRDHHDGPHRPPGDDPRPDAGHPHRAWRA